MGLKTPNKKTSSGKESKVSAGKKELMKRVATPKSRPKPPAQKEVSNDGKKEIKKSKPSKARASEEVTKPIVTEQRKSEPAQSRPADQGQETRKVTAETMKSMDIDNRFKLFKSINRSEASEVFTTILKELPKNLQIRLEEAKIKGIVGAKPKAPKGSEVHYCPYCVDWQVFYHHTWLGYTKCIGCGMSTKDFYVSADNKLFGKGE